MWLRAVLPVSDIVGRLGVRLADRSGRPFIDDRHDTGFQNEEGGPG